MGSERELNDSKEKTRPWECDRSGRRAKVLREVVSRRRGMGANLRVISSRASRFGVSARARKRRRWGAKEALGPVSGKRWGGFLGFKR